MEDLKKLMHIFVSPALTAVFGWTKGHRAKLAVICCLTVGGVLCGLFTTVAMRSLIDSAVSGEGSALVRYGIMLAALILGQRALYALAAVLRTVASAGIQKKLQATMMRDILTREYAGLKHYHSGDLVNRVFSDVSVIKNGIISLPSDLCGILVSFTGAVIILAGIEPTLVIALIIGGFVGAGLMLLLKNPMKRRHKNMQEAESSLHASVQETLENVRLVKSSLSEERILGRVEGNQEKLESAQRKQGFFSIAMNNSLGLMFDISWLACMLWGCANIFKGNMTYGTLAAMIQLIGRIQGPIAGAADIAARIYGVVASAERLQELRALPQEADEEPVEGFEQLRLQDVGFTYDDGIEEVLKNITFDIRKGEFAALTGISGGGKTSLFQLLLGIYVPVTGTVAFKTEEGWVNASRRTRGLFAYVPQGNTLISGTLRENLTLFNSGASDEEIMNAADAACVGQVIREIGLDAVIGERGIGLSEGQAQRIAVARALLCRAPILLLDEATSALDEETEARLLKNIAHMQDKTCLIVTHRRAALDICGKILHMENGRMTCTENRNTTMKQL